MNSAGFSRILVAGAMLAAVLLVAVALYLLFQVPPPAYQPSGAVEGARVGTDFSELAPLLARKITYLSPTPATSDIGWRARRIAFVESAPQAYVEYTDSHLALRVLLEYTYQGSALSAKLLATFEPDAAGDWRLTHGVDEALGRPTVIFDATGPDRWVQEFK